MDSFLAIERIAHRWTRVTGLFGLTGLMVLASLVVADVLMRWLFSSPITGVRDLGALFVAVAISACFPVVLVTESNITIRFLGHVLGPRASSVLDAFANAFVLFLLGVLFLELLEYANEQASYGASSAILRVPEAPFWYVTCAMIGSCLPVQSLIVVKNAYTAWQGGLVPPPRDEGA